MEQAAQLPSERDTALAEAQGELERLIGLPGVKEEVKRLMSFLKIQLERRRHGMRESSQSLHFVFTGNPGTGKTTVARILGKIFFGFGILKTAKVVECDRSKLVGGYVGQTAIKTDEVIQSALDGVLFIDEAYTLAGDAAKYGQGDRFGEEAINTLLKQMEDSRDRLIVIAAGYPAEMETFLRSNPGLQSRFTRFIRFEDYSVPDLCRIFDRFCRDQEYSLTPSACAMTFVLFAVAHKKRDERFGNARHVRNMYEKALSMQADRLASRGGNLAKSALATIDGQDILSGFDPAEFDPRSAILPASKWEAECPGCGKPSTAGTRFLGQRVACGCGQRFTYPWWNLVPESTPSLPADLIAKPRPGDKRGILDSAPARPRAQQLTVSPESAPPMPVMAALSDDDKPVDEQYQLAAMYQLGRGVPQSDTKAASLFRMAAERGHPRAQYSLGRLYEKGRGVPKSDTEAAAWYRKAAEQGYDVAQGTLAKMFEKGRGVPQSDTQAVFWYRRAADQGYDLAQDSLGDMFEKGRGVPQSDTEAVFWYRKGAEQGYDLAQYDLGVMYQSGRGVRTSEAEAATWFRRAAEQGLSLAQNSLGGMFRDGRGVPKNDTEAVFWYRKAAYQGDASAQSCLGMMLEFGYGVPKSGTEALYWYRKAAEQGVRLAQNRLGQAYESGRDIPMNRNEALVWYRKAAQQGYEPAKEALARLTTSPLPKKGPRRT